MCQAFEAEQRHVHNVELRYGSFWAMLNGKKVLRDYCTQHRNYWCGCEKMAALQADPKIKAKRERRRKIVTPWAAKA